MACNECGECCRVLIFEVDDRDITREFYEARGLRVVQWRHLPVVIVPRICPHLIGDLCALHGTDDYPEVCRLFPGSGEDLELQSLVIPDCGMVQEQAPF
jgi:Fe-S-cluster containining protein